MSTGLGESNWSFDLYLQEIIPQRSVSYVKVQGVQNALLKIPVLDTMVPYVVFRMVMEMLHFYDMTLCYLQLAIYLLYV